MERRSWLGWAALGGLAAAASGCAAPPPAAVPAAAGTVPPPPAAAPLTVPPGGPGGLDAPPPAGPPRAVTVPPLVEQRLPNGLTLVVATRTGWPLVSATLVVRTGPEADPVGRAGLADMVAGLLSKGASRRGRRVGATELARQAEALGGTLDTGSGWEASSAGMTVTPPALDAALALVADVVLRPLLAADELDRARAQSLDGLRVAFESPGAVAGMVARRGYWGASPYGAVQTPQSLRRLDRGDLVRFHRNWYRPDRALLVLAGDVTVEQARALALRHFGGWRAPGAAVPVLRPGVAQSPGAAGAQTVLVDMPGAGQSSVIVSAPFSTLAPADRPLLRTGQVASALLGGGYSARLNQEVRIKRGLSYGASAGAELHAQGGVLSASAQTSHPNAAQVAELMRAEILRMAQDEAPLAELGARQATLIGSFSRRLETNGGVAGLVASLWSQGRPLAELERYVDETAAVTPAQVRAFAQAYWKPESLRTVIVGDLKAGGDALAALGGGAARLQAQAIDFDSYGLGRLAP